jgi:hypothetical protein
VRGSGDKAPRTTSALFGNEQPDSRVSRCTLSVEPEAPWVTRMSSYLSSLEAVVNIKCLPLAGIMDSML